MVEKFCMEDFPTLSGYNGDYSYMITIGFEQNFLFYHSNGNVSLRTERYVETNCDENSAFHIF